MIAQHSPSKQLFLGVLLIAIGASTAYSVTISQQRRMIDIAAHRGGNVKKTVRDLLDPYKIAFWKQTIGLTDQKIVTRITKSLNTTNKLNLYQKYSLNKAQLATILTALTKKPIAELYIDLSKLSDIEASTWNQLSQLKQLTYLNLCNHSLNKSQLTTILTALANTPIAHLDLSGNNLADTDASAWQPLTRLTKLKYLTLIKCSFAKGNKSQLTIILTALKNAPIAELVLSHCDLSTVDDSAWNQISHLNQLTYLELRNCNLKEAQLKKIQTALAKTPIKTLDLATNPEVVKISRDGWKNNKKEAITVTYQ